MCYSHFNTVADTLMVLVGWVIFFGHQPFVNTKSPTWLQNLENLPINTLQTGRMYCSLNCIYKVEGIWLKIHLLRSTLDVWWKSWIKAGYIYHKVTLDVFHLRSESCRLSVHNCPLNLIIVVIETNDIAVGKSTNLASWPTNTTSNIKHSGIFSDTNLGGKVVLVSISYQLDIYSKTHIDNLLTWQLLA